MSATRLNIFMEKHPLTNFYESYAPFILNLIPTFIYKNVEAFFYGKFVIYLLSHKEIKAIDGLKNYQNSLFLYIIPLL